MKDEISGLWHNEHGSEVSFELQPGGRLVGRFLTGVGFGTDESFELTGFASGPLVAFVVSFAKHASLTSWVGHLVEDRLETLWQMTLEAPHPRDRDEQWKTVWSGANVFRRGPAPQPRGRHRGPAPAPLWVP